MQVSQWRTATIVLIVGITAGWGSYVGYHLDHWLGDDEHAPNQPTLHSTLLSSTPFEATMGPAIRQPGLATAGQVIQFDLETPNNTGRIMGLVEWHADSHSELEFSIASLEGDQWRPIANITGPSPLVLDTPIAAATSIRVTLAPAQGIILEQTATGWIAFHRPV